MEIPIFRDVCVINIKNLIMRRLYIIRHAKSSWEHHVSDLERPLKTRGFNDAELVAIHTSNLFEKPEMIFCSPSKRTVQTASVFINKWKLEDIEINYINQLYDFSGTNLVKTIRECDDRINILMIFAHNFAVTDFVNTFGTIDISSVPTCGFIVIDFEIDFWKNIEQGQTKYSVFPKELK